jgi:hypothetical protein
MAQGPVPGAVVDQNHLVERIIQHEQGPDVLHHVGFFVEGRRQKRHRGSQWRAQQTTLIRAANLPDDLQRPPEARQGKHQIIGVDRKEEDQNEAGVPAERVLDQGAHHGSAGTVSPRSSR